MRLQFDMRENIILLLLLVLFLNVSDTFSQTGRSVIPRQNFREREQKTPIVPQAEFENIINGLNSGNVGQISRYFAPQIYLSLKSGERGYYSTNQAYYLLENFFRIYEPFSFQTTSKVTETSTPYLAGRLFCRFKGSSEVCQLYLSLYWNGFRWEITQISIN